MKKLLSKYWAEVLITCIAVPMFTVAVVYGEVSVKKPQSATYTSANPGTFSIGTTNTDSSVMLALDKYKNFSYQVKCVSASDDVKYNLEFYTALEYDSTKMIEIATGNLITESTAETWTAPTSIKPPPAAYGYFKLTGVTDNTHDTLCTLLFARER